MCVCVCVCDFLEASTGNIAIISSTHPPACTGAKAVLIMHDFSLHFPHAALKLGTAVLTENIVYDKRHYFVRPPVRSVDQSVPHLFFGQHDVSFELATPLPRTLLVPDICNKTYGNLLCVATWCSSCKNSPAVLVEQLYTGLVDFVGWSLVLNFTETHGGHINRFNKLCEAGKLILT